MRDRLGSSAMTSSQADLAEADAFLVVRANPAARQPIAFDSRVRPAVNDGATLIHVDPRTTETTRLADHHLPAAPGTVFAPPIVAEPIVGQGRTVVDLVDPDGGRIDPDT